MADSYMCSDMHMKSVIDRPFDNRTAVGMTVGRRIDGILAFCGKL
jgi:hypothetical protein